MALIERAGNRYYEGGQQVAGPGQYQTTEGIFRTRDNTPVTNDPSKMNAIGNPLGISASFPAINERDVRRQTENEFSGQRTTLTNRFNRKIEEAKLKSKDERRALEGAMGTGRRFSSSAQAFLKFVDDDNNKAIADLEVQKEDALVNFDFQLANLISQRIQDKRDEQRQMFNDTIKMLELSEKMNAGEEEERKAGIQSSRDGAIAGLIKQGVTDPLDLINYLNYDDSGNLVGDFTAEEIGKTLKNLSVSGDSDNLPSEIKTFEWLRKNNRLPGAITNLPEEQQYFAYLNLQKGKAPLSGFDGGGLPIKLGPGATDSNQESVIRFRLTNKLLKALSGANPSDSERAYVVNQVDTMRAQGKTEQQIMDELSGFATEVQTPYNNSFRDIIIASSKDATDQNKLMGTVSSLLNSGNNVGAMKAVENSAMAKAKELDPDNYLGAATATTYLRNIQRIRDIMNGAVKDGTLQEDPIAAAVRGIIGGPATPGGPIAGSFQNILGRFKGQKAAQLKAELTNLYATFRRENAGTATTESELRFLEPLFADITDTKGNFMTKLDSFERQLLQRHNSTRGEVNLPTLTTAQAIDANQRLKLYEQVDLPEIGGTIDDFLNSPVPSGASWDMAPDL